MNRAAELLRWLMALAGLGFWPYYLYWGGLALWCALTIWIAWPPREEAAA